MAGLIVRPLPELPDVLLVEPQVFPDARGHFFEAWHLEKYRAAGIPDAFVQDNHSRSRRGVLRGLHAQRRHPQAKLVRAVVGEIFDVAVDVRPGSPTFGRWAGVRLSGEDRRQCYVPAGFLHGFCVLSEAAEVEYKCSTLWDPADEFGVVWNDADLAIAWPVDDPIVSPRDAVLPTFAAVRAALGA
jgi:dTDP-4-dehydrorhamnose 3,5-epimerase